METKLEVKVSFYKDEIGIISMKGELTVFNQEFDMLHREVMAYIKMGIYRFILNLEELRYIDSSGVGLVMRMVNAAAKFSTIICMVCHQPNILKIFRISKIDSFIHFVENSDEGLDFYKAR